MKVNGENLRAQWADSRSGARSGRGYRYQDAIGALDACLAWIARGRVTITPEGWEDFTVERDAGPTVHCQVKSRQRHLGPFTLGKFADFVSEGWTRHAQRLEEQPSARFELVLESGVAGFPTPPIGPLEGTDLGAALGPRLSVERTTVGAILALTSVRVEPDPTRKAIDALSRRLEIPPISCVPIAQAVRHHMGMVADANASRSVDDRACVGMTDIDRLITSTRESAMVDVLQNATSRGILEAVDWANPVRDKRFYEGVDVVPGHVAAGLVVDRPALAESASSALDDSRFVLIAGPSGCGKTALAWLVAKRRRAMPCYRVVRLREADVDAAVRFARALLPTPTCPVTFVADDLGRDSMEGFDHFVREVMSIPGVSVLGTVRNENLLLVKEAHRATLVRPTLDDGLASRLFEELNQRSATSWPHWREPLALSDGLLLEYTHILTRGDRLAAVIEAQVDERVRGGRALELHILALVATAAATGASVPWNGIETIVGGSAGEAARALRRLLDEHLVVETSDGLLAGLHQLRSHAAEAAVHRTPPLTRGRTLRQLVATIPGPQLLSLLVGALGGDEDEILLEALTDRLRQDPDADVVMAVLKGLRLAELNAHATTWAEKAKQHGVPPALAPLVFSAALAEMDFGNLPIDERVVKAVEEIGAVPIREEYRARLLDSVGPGLVVAALTARTDQALGAVLLGTLDGLEVVPLAETWPPADFLAEAIETAPLPLLAEILDSLTRIDRDVAVANVSPESEQTIVRRIARETAWLRNLSINESKEGTTASCVWLAAVEPDGQSIHDLVIDIARIVCWCLPRVDEVEIRAILADGEDAVVDETPVASKRLNRSVLLSRDRLRWNQARLAAASALVAVPSASARLATEASLLSDAARITSEFGRKWVTGKSDLRSLERSRVALQERVHALGPAPITALQVLRHLEDSNEPGSPLTKGVGDAVALDIAKFVLPGLASSRNLLGTAALIGRDLMRLDEVSEPEAWSLIGLSEAPPSVGQLRATLNDLQAIAFGLACGDVRRQAIHKVGLAGRPHTALGRAARLARATCRKRFETQLEEFLQVLGDDQVSAEKIVSPGDSTAPWWPIVEISLLVHVESLLDWPAVLDTITGHTPEDLNMRGLTVAPLRDNCIIDGLAGRLVRGKWLEHSDAIRRTDESPLPPSANTVTADAFARAVAALTTISAMVAWDTPDYTNDAEKEALDATQEEYRNSAQFLLDQDLDDPIIQASVGGLAGLADRVQDEAENPVDLPQSLAAELCRAGRGSNPGKSESMNMIRGGFFFLLEWDIDRQNACRLYEELT